VYQGIVEPQGFLVTVPSIVQAIAALTGIFETNIMDKPDHGRNNLPAAQ
jgi:hypothetical protein